MLTNEELEIIELAKRAELDIPALSIYPLEWWYVQSVEYLQGLGLSLRSIIGDVKEATLRDEHAITMWRVWLCGVGVTDRLQEVGFTLLKLPEDQVLISWGDDLHKALRAEAAGIAVPSVMPERWAANA